MTDPIDTIPGLLPSGSQEPVACSVVSRIAGEQLFGSVSQTAVWFLLEYDHPMGAKAFEESAIPQAVKDHLNATLKSTPGARLQLIRQKRDPAQPGLAFFTAIARDQNPSLYEFHLQAYEELLSFDLVGVLSESPSVQAYKRLDPLFLVCTNARRDPCCARWGLPVYDALSQEEPSSTWQTSHVGGHRYAANVLFFPAGIYYGRVDPAEVKNLVSACRRSEVRLASLRGRACYSPEAQAAEYFLRSQTGEAQVDAYHLESIEPIAASAWKIRFREKAGDNRYQLEVTGKPAPSKIYESCKSAQPISPMEYRLITFEELL